MQRRDSRLLLSATDLVNFHECEHLSALDRAALDDEALKAQRAKPDDQAELLLRKGREFEASYLEELKRLHPGAGEVVEIADPFKDPGKAAAVTLAAMRAGASDFVVKPVGAERLQVSIKNALKLGALEDEIRRMKRRASGTLGFHDLSTRSAAESSSSPS